MLRRRRSRYGPDPQPKAASPCALCSLEGPVVKDRSIQTLCYSAFGTQGQPEIALPLYIQAIEALLVGASADTNAKRVAAIRTKVDRWLQAAEGIDASLEVNNKE